MIQRLCLDCLIVMVALVMAGCGSEDGSTPPLVEPGSTAQEASSTQDTPADPGTSRCDELQVRECHIALPGQGSVQNCFAGLQLCADGKWGPCSDPSVIEARLPNRN